MLRSPDKSEISKEAINGSYLTNRFRNCVYLALAGHLFFIADAPRRMEEIYKNRDAMAHMAGEIAKTVVKASFEEMEAFKNEVERKIESGEQVNLGDFYLRDEYTKGRIDRARMDEAQAKLGSIEHELKKMAETSDQKGVLNKIIDHYPSADLSKSYLSTALLGGAGNCNAVEKLSSALIQRVYPDLKTRSQVLKIGGVMHIRTLVELEDGWYSMEVPHIAKVSPEAMNGTVVYESQDIAYRYAGYPIKGKYINEGDFSIPRTYTEITFTDAVGIADVPLPVPISEIRSFDNFENSNTGEPSGDHIAGGAGVAQGNGTKENSNDKSVAQYNSKDSDEWVEYNQWELLNQTEVDEMVAVSKKWETYLEVKQEDEAKELPPLPESKKWESFSWHELMYSFISSFHRNTQERIPAHSSIIEHSLFQNYSMKNVDILAYNYHSFVEAISRNEHAQESLYDWAKPYLEKVYLTFDRTVREKHLSTLIHLREYLANYDHDREKKYLEMLEAENNGDQFLFLSPSDAAKFSDPKKIEEMVPAAIKAEFPDFNGRRADLEGYLEAHHVSEAEGTRILKRIFPQSIFGENFDSMTDDDFKNLSDSEQKRLTDRYAEAFVFRRIEDGMSIETARRWVEQGITDMEALMDKPQVEFIYDAKTKEARMEEMLPAEEIERPYVGGDDLDKY